KAEEGNSDGLLILNDPKEPANAKEEVPNIGIEVEKDDPKALGWYSKKENPAGLNNEQIRMDYQRLTDIRPTAEGTNENKESEAPNRKMLIVDFELVRFIYDNSTVLDISNNVIRRN
ncbi:10106_t:CDS:2, partial [Cetraspora pellucida]